MGEEVLGTAAKIEVTKDNCTIVGDGSSEESVKSRVKQIKNLVENTDQDYEKEKLNERIARLSGGVAIIQVFPFNLISVCFPIFHWAKFATLVLPGAFLLAVLFHCPGSHFSKVRFGPVFACSRRSFQSHLK